MKRIKLAIEKTEAFLSKHFLNLINESLFVFLSSILFSVFIFYQGFNENEFIKTNILDIESRSKIFLIFILVFLSFASFSFAASIYKSKFPNLHLLYRSCLLLSILLNISILFNEEIRFHYILFFGLIFLFNLNIFLLLKYLPFKPKLKVLNNYINKGSYTILIIASTALILYIIIDLNRLLQLQKSVDLGIYNNVIYRLTHYFDSYTAIYEQKFFSQIHFSPILILVSIPYHFFPSPFFLPILQDVLLVAGGVMLYKLSLLITKDKFFSSLLTISFFLSPLLHGILHFDFHEIAFFPFLFLLFIYLIEKERLLFSLFILLLTLSIKEEIALYILPFSLYIFYRLKNLPYTIFYVFFSLAYYIFATKFYMDSVMVARFGGVIANEYEGFAGMFATFLSNPIYVVKQIIQNENKIIFLLVLLFSTGFIALKSKQFLLLILPASFVSILASYWLQYSFSYHYGGPILPIIYFLAVLGYKNLKEPFKEKMGIIITFNSVLLLMFYSPLYATASLRVTKDMFQDFKSFLVFAEQVPKNKIVSANHSISLFFTQRDTIQLFPVIKNSEFIVIDLNAAPWPLTSKDQLIDTLAYLEKSRQFSVKAMHKNGIVLLNKFREQDNKVFTKISDTSSNIYSGFDLPTIIGKINCDTHSNFKFILSNKNPNSKEGFLVYGPYINLDPGTYKVIFNLKATDRLEKETEIGFVDVFATYQLLSKLITSKEAFSDSSYKKKEIEFTISQPTSNVEFRIFCNGKAEILFDYLELVKLN